MDRLDDWKHYCLDFELGLAVAGVEVPRLQVDMISSFIKWSCSPVRVAMAKKKNKGGREQGFMARSATQ